MSLCKCEPSCETYFCEHPGHSGPRAVPWCSGACDDHPDWCDECWARQDAAARGLLRSANRWWCAHRVGLWIEANLVLFIALSVATLTLAFVAARLVARGFGIELPAEVHQVVR